MEVGVALVIRIVAGIEPGAGAFIDGPAFTALVSKAPGLLAPGAVEATEMSAATESDPDDAIGIYIDGTGSGTRIGGDVGLKFLAGRVIAYQSTSADTGLGCPHTAIHRVRNHAVVESSYCLIRAAVTVAVYEYLRVALGGCQSGGVIRIIFCRIEPADAEAVATGP